MPVLDIRITKQKQKIVLTDEINPINLRLIQYAVHFKGDPTPGDDPSHNTYSMNVNIDWTKNSIVHNVNDNSNSSMMTLDYPFNCSDHIQQTNRPYETSKIQKSFFVTLFKEDALTKFEEAKLNAVNLVFEYEDYN